MELRKHLAVCLSTSIALGVAVSAVPPSAVASCAGLQPLPRVLATAPVVFVGKVISTRQHSTMAMVRVKEVWRGRHVPEVAVVEGDSPEDFRIFQVGVTYLFVPARFRRVSPYRDDACTATRRYSPAVARYRPRSAHAP